MHKGAKIEEEWDSHFTLLHDSSEDDLTQLHSEHLSRPVQTALLHQVEDKGGQGDHSEHPRPVVSYRYVQSSFSFRGREEEEEREENQRETEEERGGQRNAPELPSVDNILFLWLIEHADDFRQ